MRGGKEEREKKQKEKHYNSIIYIEDNATSVALQ